MIAIGLGVIIWAMLGSITGLIGYTTASSVERQVTYNTPLVRESAAAVVEIRAHVQAHQEKHLLLEREMDRLRTDMQTVTRENQQLRRLLALRMMDEREKKNGTPRE